MLYYYKKIEQGKDAGKYIKVTVEEKPKKFDAFLRVVDAEIVDNVDMTMECIYVDGQNA